MSAHGYFLCKACKVGEAAMRYFGLALFLLFSPFTAAAIAAPGITIPIAFEPNFGDVDSRAQFVARTANYTLFLSTSEVVFVPRGREADSVIRLQFVKSNPHAVIEGVDAQKGHVSYFVSRDTSRWRSNIPLYGKVRVKEIYPGTDVLFYVRGEQLEYDLVIKPGADPKKIQLHVNGASVALNRAGDLVIRNATGEMIQHKPAVHQVIDHMNRRVPSEFLIAGKSDVTFGLGEIRADAPVVIDPVIDYSSYLGGSGSDIGLRIRVDRDGSIYVMGVTNSSDFPIKNSAGGGVISNTAFITKLTADGQSLIYSLFFANNIHPTGFAVDPQGYAYLSGWTQSSALPIVNALQPALRGPGDLFVAKFDPAGSSIVYSTYLGGSGLNEGTAVYGGADVIVNASGNAYLTGTTDSSDFPVRNAYQPALKGRADAFIAKLDATGSALLFSTYLGGTADDRGTRISIDKAENIYVGGQTTSTDYPVTAAAFQTRISCRDPGCHAPGTDLFVSKLSPSATALVYSTYLGGGGSDEVEQLFGMTVDSGGDVYLTGNTQSFNFPKTSGVCGDEKGKPFFSRLDATGSRLAYSVCDGVEGQTGSSIVVDENQNAYASTIDLVSPVFPSHLSLTKFGPAGEILDRFKFGGQSETSFCCVDFAYDAALLNGHVLYVTGSALSNNIPNVHAVQPANRGNGDAFISVIDFAANRFEESSNAIQYSDIWANHTSLAHSGGAAKLAVNPGARATFTFSGQSVKWIAFRDQWAGIANVYIDGVFKQEVDTYASPQMAQTVMFNATGLTSGVHTLTVEVAGRRNPSSMANWVWIDAFDASTAADGGTTQNGTGPTTAVTRVEQANPSVAYSGLFGWTTVNRAFFSAGSATLSALPGARATFTFSGTQARWIGFKDSYAGIVNVYVDGILQTQVDTYAFESRANVVLYTSPTLAAGTHTLTIEATGTRNAMSGGNWIWVDAFEFVP